MRMVAGTAPWGPINPPAIGSPSGNAAHGPAASSALWKASTNGVTADFSFAGALADVRTRMPWIIPAPPIGVNTLAVAPAALRAVTISVASNGTSGPIASYETTSMVIPAIVGASVAANCCAATSVSRLGAIFTSSFIRASRSVSANLFAIAADSLARAVSVSLAEIRSLEKCSLAAPMAIAPIVPSKTAAAPTIRTTFARLNKKSAHGSVTVHISTFTVLGFLAVVALSVVAISLAIFLTLKSWSQWGVR